VHADGRWTADALLARCNEALSWKMESAGVSSAQELLDKIAVNAGRSPEDWYVLAMTRMGLDLDYSAYAEKLFSVCKDPEPTNVEQYRRYLVARAMGYESIPGPAPEALKEKGIMSVIYRGYAAAAGRAKDASALSQAQQELMALKLADGGYALMGTVSDVDVTGFALQMYGALLAASGTSSMDEGLESAVRDAFAALSKRQQADGGYASFGTANSESGAMVLLAFAAFSDTALPAEERGIDAAALIDATEKFRTPNGGYAHALTGGVASMENDLATAQVMCAYAAYASYLKHGTGILYPAKVLRAPVTTREETTAPTEEITKVPATREESSSEPREESTAYSPSAHESESETAESTREDAGAETSESGTETPGGAKETTDSTKSDGTSDPSPTTIDNSEDNTFKSPTNETEQRSESDAEPSDPAGKTLTKTRLRCIMTAVVAGILLLALLANAFSKRKSKLTYVILLLLGAAALIFVWVSKITLPEQATLKQQQSYLERLPAQGEFRIQISIDQRVEGEEMLLSQRLVTVSEDDTVFDILKRVTMAYGIGIDYTKSMVGTVYVRAIGGHAEFDRGAGSGWVFLVNDALATTDAGSVKLSEGDVVRWAYTLDLGKDVSP